MRVPPRATGALLAGALLTGCSGVRILNTLTFWGGYTRTTVRYDGQRALDVYAPAAAHGAPVLVFFYGGSWQKATTRPRADYKFVGQALSARGYVTVIPDYRVHPDVRYPVFLEDCARAVRWSRDHAAEYGGDPSRLVLMGHSAGAYNAAMLVLDPEYLQTVGVPSHAVRGFVGLAGPYDFLPLQDDALRDVFSPAGDLQLTQPINYARGDAPPMLLLAGEDDDTVYARNSEHLAARINAAGGHVREVIYPRMDHVKIVATLATLLQSGSDVGERAGRFIDEVTAAPGAAPPP